MIDSHRLLAVGYQYEKRLLAAHLAFLTRLGQRGIAEEVLAGLGDCQVGSDTRSVYQQCCEALETERKSPSAPARVIAGGKR